MPESEKESGFNKNRTHQTAWEVLSQAVITRPSEAWARTWMANSETKSSPMCDLIEPFELAFGLVCLGLDDMAEYGKSLGFECHIKS